MAFRWLNLYVQYFKIAVGEVTDTTEHTCDVGCGQVLVLS